MIGSSSLDRAFVRRRLLTNNGAGGRKSYFLQRIYLFVALFLVAFVFFRDSKSTATFKEDRRRLNATTSPCTLEPTGAILPAADALPKVC